MAVRRSCSRQPLCRIELERPARGCFDEGADAGCDPLDSRHPQPCLSRRTLLAAAPAAALFHAAPDNFAILDADAAPGLNGAGRDTYRRFLMMDLPRAFAIGTGGICAAAGGAMSLAVAREEALARCVALGGRDARIYAENLDIVWVHAAGPPPPPRPALIESWNDSFVPDNRFLWRGPVAARGVYIWAHGTSTDPLGLQPPPHVRIFNNAGYDIVRFDRVPNADDVNRAAQWLRGGIARMRVLGWKRVLAGGHSRGGWNCLQMCRYADLADVVIAESPAAHGVASGLFMSSQTDDLRQIVDDVPRTHTKLAFIQFRDDPYTGDASSRLALIERLRQVMGGLLVIDRPAGFSGHFAARALIFAEAFGDALLRFGA